MVLKCECGGTLQPAHFDEFDFSPFAGIRVLVNGVDGLRCSKCQGETLEGETINRLLRASMHAVLKFPNRLPNDFARFLRKRMRITQEELASRMCVNRVTIADWESGAATISPHHDFMLRAIATGFIMQTLTDEERHVMDFGNVLSRARNEILEGPHPVVIKDFLEKARSSTRHAN